MAEIAADWNGDFRPSSTGDLLLISGDEATIERLVRRLLTAVKGYIYHLEYGSGLPQQIGNTQRQGMLQALVNSQIRLESAVATVPPPIVTVTESLEKRGLFVIDVKFTSTETGAALNFSLTA